MTENSNKTHNSTSLFLTATSSAKAKIDHIFFRPSLLTDMQVAHDVGIGNNDMVETARSVPPAHVNVPLPRIPKSETTGS